MEIIDRMLDQMGELGFSVEELSIFLDLKLRERAMDTPSLRAAVIECNPPSGSHPPAAGRPARQMTRSHETDPSSGTSFFRYPFFFLKEKGPAGR